MKNNFLHCRLKNKDKLEALANEMRLQKEANGIYRCKGYMTEVVHNLVEAEYDKYEWEEDT